MDEIASLRHSDGTKYITPLQFTCVYPLGDKIASGAYGSVFASGSKYAIKVFCKKIDLIIELNIYSSVTHPCIMKPVAWTIIDCIGYIIMKRGYDIQEALHDKLITIEEVIADTLSAVTFLNSQGIEHGDIKPSNIMFHKNKAKLIDMGFACYGELNTDGRRRPASQPTNIISQV